MSSILCRHLALTPLRFCFSAWNKHGGSQELSCRTIHTLGNSSQEPSQVFVIIDGQAQEKLLQAVDVCFKGYYIFFIEYPKQCQHVWEFLQGVVYGLPLLSPGRVLSF